MTSIEDKLAFMNMTLDDKIKRTKQLIMEWYAQKDLCITSEQLTEKWVNIYKSKKYGDSYWTGTFGYITKEDAMEDLADKENYLTTINIEEVPKLQEENKRLKHDVGNLGYKIKNQRKEIERQIAQNAQLKELLKECIRQFEEVELCRYDVADIDQEDWFKISTEQADIANKMLAKIDEVLK